MRKIKLVHLLSLPNEEREKKSIKDLSRLADFGIEYTQNINEPYTKLPPKETCMHPDRVSSKSGYWKRSPSVYGCYLAHKNAVLQEFDDDIDFLLVCECDTQMLVEPEKFYTELMKVCDAFEKERDIVYVNLGEDTPRTDWHRNIKETIGDALSIVDKTLGCMGILYQKSSIDIVKEKFLNEKWDGADIWQQEVFANYRKAYSKTPLIKEHTLFGESLIDRVDAFNNLKSNHSNPNLIAELVFREGHTKEPIFIYDKLDLFATPNISHDNRLNLPYNQKAENIKIDKIYLSFYLNDQLFESKTFFVMFNGSWWFWEHPYLTQLLNKDTKGKIKIKIKVYG